jgi:hypothetical protein
VTTMDKKSLFLALESNAVAPSDLFDSFVVGDALQRGYTTLVSLIDGMLNGTEPSRFQLVVGENGNGKTLLAHRIMRWLTDKNFTNAKNMSASFDALYSHISQLGSAKGRHTGLEIAANLRRSQIEDPEYTYSLIAIRIASDFEDDYNKDSLPFPLRLFKLVTFSALDLATGGILDKLDEALRDKSVAKLKKILDETTRRFQKLLTKKHYGANFAEFISDLELDSFVNTYFKQRTTLGIDQLRKGFLLDMDRNPAIVEPREVVKQIARIGRKVGCRIIVIIIDDCNHTALVEQLLPLINDLSEFTNPRLCLIANMLQSKANEIQNMTGDRSIAARILYNREIKLTPPDRNDIGSLYDKLRILYNEAFPDRHKFVPEGLSGEAADKWSKAVQNHSVDGPSYRSAIRFLTEYVRQSTQ